MAPRILLESCLLIFLKPFNWVIDFLKDRKQGVCIDNIAAPFLPINRGVPQGTVLGPVLFTIIVNDIIPTSKNILMTKYAVDVTCSIPVGPNVDDYASRKVENIKSLGSEEFNETQFK